MRNVLIVLGIAVLAIGLSILFSKPKNLHPSPQDLAYERQQEEDRKEQEKNKRQQATAPKPAPNTKPEAPTPPPAGEPFSPPREGAIRVVLSVKDRGDITLELYPKAAPKTVEQITRLIREKFYDGILVHRVNPFVIQAGDPETRKFQPSDLAYKDEQAVGAMGLGGHGSGKTIPLEKNALTHVTGTIAMARRADPDTADSQWYINLRYNDNYDGDYCVFGRVVSGMNYVESITQGDVITSFRIK